MSHAPNWTCSDRQVALWFFDKVEGSLSQKLSNANSPKDLNKIFKKALHGKKCEKDCEGDKVAFAWCCKALSSYSAKEKNYLNKTIYYLFQGLKVDPVHTRLIALKEEVFPLQRTQDTTEKILFEKALREKKSLKRKEGIFHILDLINKRGYSNSPLRLYYLCKIRDNMMLLDEASHKTSIRYIEGFFACVYKEFFEDHPEIYSESYFLHLKIYFNFIYFSVAKKPQVADQYIEKLKKLVKKIQKKTDLSENKRITDFIDNIKEDLPYLNYFLLFKKIYYEEEDNPFALITFIRIFPENFQTIENAEILINAAVIFYKQSEKSSDIATRIKYIEKGYKILQFLSQKYPHIEGYKILYKDIEKRYSLLKKGKIPERKQSLSSFTAQKTLYKSIHLPGTLTEQLC